MQKDFDCKKSGEAMKMVVEVKGQQLRIRMKDPSSFDSFKTQDVGKKGHLQRVVGFKAGKGFQTQSWRLNLDDYSSFDEIKSDLSKIKGLTPAKRKKALALAKDYRG